ncbi:MAG TPA: hypothetical protein VGJ21_11270 [Terracidiphilus sp.]|jgi:hypothetical protein
MPISIRIAALAVLLGATPQSQPSARDRLNTLEARVGAAVKAGDHQARIAADKEVLGLLNGSPDAVEALARAYAAAGDADNALAALNRVADLGVADDNLLAGNDRNYEALKLRPEYKELLERFRRNEEPVSLGTPVITMPDAGLLTEDIDFDPPTRTFLITSVLENKIVRAGLDGRVTDFASSPDRWPVLAVKVDSKRGRVWATEVALDGFTVAPKDAWGRSAVLCYDLKTGKLLNRIEGPPHSALGDMVLTGGGDPIISDGQDGQLYRLANGDLHAIDTNEFISPQTPARGAAADSILVPDYLRGIGILNLRTHHVSWIDAAKTALNGVDGVYTHGRSAILTQNGTSPQRVLLAELDPSLKTIVSSKVIEQASADFGDPTHGVFVGDDFYYIANSGWNQLDDHGDVKAGSRLTAARIMRYSVK